MLDKVVFGTVWPRANRAFFLFRIWNRGDCPLLLCIILHSQLQYSLTFAPKIGWDIVFFAVKPFFAYFLFYHICKICITLSLLSLSLLTYFNVWAWSHWFNIFCRKTRAKEIRALKRALAYILWNRRPLVFFQAKTWRWSRHLRALLEALQINKRLCFSDAAKRVWQPLTKR